MRHLLFAFFALVLAPAALAQNYMKIEGIEGAAAGQPVSLTGHELVVERDVSAGSGSMPSTRLRVTKLIDFATPALFQAVVTGQTFPGVEIYIDDGFVPYTIRLQNVMITSIHQTSGDTDLPFEALGLMFDGIIVSTDNTVITGRAQ